MGSKISVLKNKTIDNKNEKRPIQNIIRKLNPFSTKNIPEKPFVRENKTVHEKIGCFSQNHIKLQSNSINSVAVKDSKATVCNRRVYDQTLHEDETNYLKEQSEKHTNESRINDKVTHGQIQIYEPSHRYNQTAFGIDENDSESTESVRCSDDCSDDENTSDQFNLADELCYFIGENFNICPQPVTECLTLTLSEEIISYMEKNQQLVPTGEGGFSRKDIMESWLENNNNKMINRYEFLDKACSTDPGSDIVGPSSLNVAFVRGLVYRRELFGPDQAGQAGPSQPQFPVGTEEYLLTRQYNYDKNHVQAKMPDHNTFGCMCARPWNNCFGMCSPPPTTNHPLYNLPVENAYCKNDVELETKDEPKPNLKSSKVSVKKSKGKKRAPSAKPSPTRKGNLIKTAGKRETKAAKTVKEKTLTMTSSLMSTISSEREQSPPTVMKTKKKSKTFNKTAKNKKSSTVKSKSSGLKKENSSKKPKSKHGKKITDTIKKQGKKQPNKSKISSPTESDEDGFPSTGTTSKSKTMLKNNVNTDNDNNFLFGTSDKDDGGPNIRIGISRPDDSGYHIMFKDKGDMKFKVEQVISGKSRVFTYNSGNEAVNMGNNTDVAEVKTAIKEPSQKPNEEGKKKRHSPVRKNSKDQRNSPIKLNVVLPANLAKPRKLSLGKSAESGIMKFSHTPHKPSIESNNLHPRHSGISREFFQHPSAAPAHDADAGHRREHKSKDTIKSFEEFAKPHHDTELNKTNVRLIQESLQPILEKLQPKDMGSSDERNYTAEVNTDKCTVEGNKIECLTSIPHVKVVFDLPGGHGKKIETLKPIIAPTQNDIHVDVGLEKIGPKFLDQVNPKVARPLMSSENLFAKQDVARKSEQLDNKQLLKNPIYRQSMSSLHSIDSTQIYSDFPDKTCHEANKMKSKLYDANRLLEIKECLSQMRLELRNECPCLASRFQDRLEEKHGKTDRVIIIHTKKRNNDECSDDSGSDNENEQGDSLQTFAADVLGKIQNKLKRKVNEDIKKIEEPESSEINVNESSENEEKQFKNKPSQQHSKLTESSEELSRYTTNREKSNESLNHPEMESNVNTNQPNDGRSARKSKKRKTRVISKEGVYSVLNHPESTVTEQEALMSKINRKSNYSKGSEEKIKDYEIVDESYNMNISETDVVKGKMERNDKNNQSTGSLIRWEKDVENTKNIESNEVANESGGSGWQPDTNDKTPTDHYEPKRSSLKSKNLREQNESVEEFGKKKSRDYGRVAFQNVDITPSSTSLNESGTARPRSSTGIFYEGQNLLKQNLNNEESPFKKYTEGSEQSMSELEPNIDIKYKTNQSQDSINGQQLIRPSSSIVVFHEGQNILKQNVKEEPPLKEVTENSEQPERDTRNEPTQNSTKINSFGAHQTHTNSDTKRLSETDNSKNSIQNKQGHINFQNLTNVSSSSSNEIKTSRPRTSTGVYYEGQKLLRKYNFQDEQNKTYPEDIEETSSELLEKAKTEKPNKPRQQSVQNVTKTVRDSKNFSTGSLVLNDGQNSRKNSTRRKTEDALNHPEMSESSVEGFHKTVRDWAKKRESEKSGRFLLNHPESTITEQDALMTRISVHDIDRKSRNSNDLKGNQLRKGVESDNKLSMENKGNERIKKNLNPPVSRRDVYQNINVASNENLSKASAGSNKNTVGDRKYSGTGSDKIQNKENSRSSVNSGRYRSGSGINESAKNVTPSRTKEANKNLKPAEISRKDVSQNINVASDETLPKESASDIHATIGNNEQRKNNATGSGKGQNSNTNPSKTENLIESTLDQKALDESEFGEMGNVLKFRSSIRSESISIADKSSNEIIRSSRVSHNEWEVKLGRNVDKNSVSQILDQIENKMNNDGSNKAGKVGHDMNLKRTSVSNKGQKEDKDGEKLVQPMCAETKKCPLMTKDLKESMLDANKPNDLKRPEITQSNTEENKSIRSLGSSRDVKPKLSTECGPFEIDTEKNEALTEKYNKTLKPDLTTRKGSETTSREIGENVSSKRTSQSGSQLKVNARYRSASVQGSTDNQISSRKNSNRSSYDDQNKVIRRDSEVLKENGTREGPRGVLMKCCCGTVCPPRSVVNQERQDNQERRRSSHKCH